MTQAAVAAVASLKRSGDLVLAWDNSLEDAVACPHTKATPQWFLGTYGALDWAGHQRALCADKVLQRHRSNEGGNR